jgi:hypothetical protein
MKNKQARWINGVFGGQQRREYICWKNMKSRCNTPSATGYKNYGGRGIKVCERWEKSYDAFLADMGVCPRGYTIERIDNDKGYYPENCKWATRTENNNNARSNVYIELLPGWKKSISRWCAELGIIKSTAFGRHYRGMDGKEILLKGIQEKMEKNPDSVYFMWLEEKRKEELNI